MVLSFLDHHVQGKSEETEKYQLLEGDLRVTQREMMEKLQRKIVANPKKRWPRDKDGKLIIKYYVDDDVDATKTLMALAHWELETCIRFEALPPQDDPPPDHSPYLKFENDATGCSSNVGMTASHSENGIFISGMCEVTSIVHEIGHRMGLVHEQNRPDRDEFLFVVHENIMPQNYPDFALYGQTVNLSIPYDYSSLMQYDPMSFSNGIGPTMIAKDPLFQEVLGERYMRKGNLSFMDSKIINLAYGCIDDWSKKCSATFNCTNGGYPMQDPLGQCMCRCPAGTNGVFCENYVMSYNQAVLEELSPNTEVLEIPAIISAQTDTRFTKVIIAPECQKVLLKVNIFNLMERLPMLGCRMDYIQIRPDGGLGPEDLQTFCGTEVAPGRFFTSFNRTMALHSKTSSMFGAFSATVSFIDGGC